MSPTLTLSGIFLLLAATLLEAAPADSSGCDMFASSNSISAVRKCYSRGPVLAASMLPTPRTYGLAGSIEVSCEEITGYILALNRFYERRCTRMRHECPRELQYAINWFATVGTDLAIQCDAKRSKMADSAANEKDYDSRFPNIQDAVDYDPDPYFPTYKPDEATPGPTKG